MKKKVGGKQVQALTAQRGTHRIQVIPQDGMAKPVQMTSDLVLASGVKLYVKVTDPSRKMTLLCGDTGPRTVRVFAIEWLV